jgi:quercetin dioxygenase-like cupin family protein
VAERPLDDVRSIPPRQIWDGVSGRVVAGESLTLGVVELAPNAAVPEHRHANEQLGLVITGSVRFRVGDETRELGPGGTWCIPGDTPHEVHAGPEGAVVIDVVAPPRAEWNAIEPDENRPPAWPA